MSNEEKIWLGLAFVGLVAVLLFQRSPIAGNITTAVADVGMSLTPDNTSLTRGPSYLVYNSPWAFSPPTGNFLPSITAGQIGQTVNVPTNFDPNGCGCGG